MRARDLEIVQADGRIYSVSLRPTSSGGFVITRTDITERRRAEAMIRDREALLATVLDTIPVAIVMARRDDGRIVYRSKEAQKTFPARGGVRAGLLRRSPGRGSNTSRRCASAEGSATTGSICAAATAACSTPRCPAGWWRTAARRTSCPRSAT